MEEVHWLLNGLWASPIPEETWEYFNEVHNILDEYSFEVEDGVQDIVKELSVKGIVKAGELLKLSLPLAAEGKMSFEGSWRDVH